MLHLTTCISITWSNDILLVEIMHVFLNGHVKCVLLLLLTALMLRCFQCTDEEFSSSELLVGVLSARHHHDLRQVIRDTWLGYPKDPPEFQHRSVPPPPTLTLTPS